MDSTSGERPQPQQPQQPQPQQQPQQPSSLQQTGDKIADALVAGLTVAAQNPEAQEARDLARDARMRGLVEQRRQAASQTPSDGQDAPAD